MNRKVVIGGAVALAVVAVGYIAADRSADARAKETLEELAAGLGTGEQLTWTAVDAEPLSRRAVVEGLTYSRADGYQAKAATVTASRVSDTGIGGLEISAITITAPGEGDVTIQTVTAEGIAPMGDLPPGLSDDAKAAFFASHLTADRVAVADVTLTAAGQDGMLALAGLTMENVRDGHFGTIAFNDLAATAPDGTGVSFASLTAADLDLSSLATDDPDVRRKAAGSLFGLSSLTAEKVELSGTTEGAVTVGTLVLDGLERMDGTLVSSRLRVDHLGIPAAVIAANNGPLGAAMADLGQDRLDASIEAAQRYVVDDGAFTFGPLRLRGEGLGEAVFQADFRNVPLLDLARAIDAQDYAAAQMMASDVSFIGAHLTYTDDRLADVLVDRAADGDREAFGEILAAFVTAGAGRNVPREDVAMIAGAVKNFIVGTNGFTLAMAPEQPVLLPVAMVALQAGQAAKALALTAEGH